MKYEIEIWTVQDLLDLHDAGRLDLNPPYQRNDVWSASAQKSLVDTITHGQPIPNFFMLKTTRGRYEMVDGQQRARTIIGYEKGIIPDTDGSFYAGQQSFKDYRLNVCVLRGLKQTESIEKFYALVNSSGLRLNRPEIKKADFYDTRFQQLITTLASSPEFSGLSLFSERSANRMNDIEFVSELVALLEYGIAEKKERVDQMYEHDISQHKYDDLEAHFKGLLAHIVRFDGIHPIRWTRYKQKNDFYSLFAFLRDAPPLTDATLDYFYKILVRIGPHISPSNEDCPPLMDYAVNCVTQSNSKKAREGRATFLQDLLLNQSPKANEVQSQVLDFFHLDDTEIVRKQGFRTLKASRLPPA